MKLLYPLLLLLLLPACATVAPTAAPSTPPVIEGIPSLGQFFHQSMYRAEPDNSTAYSYKENSPTTIWGDFSRIIVAAAPKAKTEKDRRYKEYEYTPPKITPIRLINVSLTSKPITIQQPKIPRVVTKIPNIIPPVKGLTPEQLKVDKHPFGTKKTIRIGHIKIESSL